MKVLFFMLDFQSQLKYCCSTGRITTKDNIINREVLCNYLIHCHYCYRPTGYWPIGHRKYRYFETGSAEAKSSSNPHWRKQRRPVWHHADQAEQERSKISRLTHTYLYIESQYSSLPILGTGPTWSWSYKQILRAL